jgi:TRAP-type uncharacterized transport system substrate-binding protein
MRTLALLVIATHKLLCSKKSRASNTADESVISEAHPGVQMRPGLSKPLLILIGSAVILLVLLYGAYRWVDPLPPRRFAIGAGPPGSGYGDAARQYGRILARDGIRLDIHDTAGGVENVELLRDRASGVEAALTAFGFDRPSDADNFYSLGGIFDAPIFIFYRNAEPITLFAQFQGKRISLGKAGTGQQFLMLEVLKATNAFAPSIEIVDLDFDQSINALIAGGIDAAFIPQLDTGGAVQRAYATPGVRLMNVAQAEAIAKTVAGLKHVVLPRGLVSLGRDIPDSNVDLLASRNRALVRKDLHPALQYLLLEAMREVHWAPGPFNRLGEFPSEQPNDLPLSPTAQAFYRSGASFWQRYTSFWLTSLLNRIVFFVIPIIVALIPVLGYAPRFYRWLHVHRIDHLHRALGKVERDLDRGADSSRLSDHQKQLAEIEAAVRSLKVARPYEVDAHRLRVHLRLAQEELKQMEESLSPNGTRRSNLVEPRGVEPLTS